jgi:hypothetical protein
MSFECVVPPTEKFSLPLNNQIRTRERQNKLRTGARSIVSSSSSNRSLRKKHPRKRATKQNRWNKQCTWPGSLPLQATSTRHEQRETLGEEKTLNQSKAGRRARSGPDLPASLRARSGELPPTRADALPPVDELVVVYSWRPAHMGTRRESLGRPPPAAGQPPVYRLRYGVGKGPEGGSDARGRGWEAEDGAETESPGFVRPWEGEEEDGGWGG